MKNPSFNPYNYLTLKDTGLPEFQNQIINLLSIYYENPEEVFKMICRGRIFFTAFYQSKLIGLYTVKHTNLNEKTVLAYLGLLVMHPDHGRILKNLVTLHIKFLETYIDHNILIYSLTGNPQVHKIASKFYHNVFPRKLDEKENEIPDFYEHILSYTDYKICQGNPYKVIDSPSIAKYTKAFAESLLEVTANFKNNFYEIYNLEVESRDRLLIIGTYSH